MAKAGRKHQRHERVIPNGQSEPVPQVDQKKTHLDDLVLQAHRLAEAGNLDESFKICSDILNEDPFKAEALFIISYVLLKTERYGIALHILNECTRLAPQREQVWNNLGLVNANLHRSADAMKCLQKSLEVAPQTVEALTAPLNNMALVAVNECTPEKAIEYCDKSLALKDDQSEVHETRGYASLLLRRWHAGWSGYEKAIGVSKYRLTKPLGKEPYWNGERGGRLFVRGEQGIGDEIMYASCIPDAMKENRIIFETDSRLAGLFKRSLGCKVIGTRQHKGDRQWRAEADAHCLAGTLSHHYRNRDEDFSGEPFLKADPERRMQWRALLDTLPGKKVGIAWTGGLRNTFVERRSLSLSQLSPLFAVPDISWVSLQYKAPTDLAEAPVKIHHWARASEAQDLDEVAALIAELDFVISVSTATVHIAGGLGKECWVFVPEKPHWIYGLTGDTLPWYKSVSLFRQNGDWSGIINQVGDKLAERVRGDGPTPADSVHSIAELDNPASEQTGLHYALNPVAAAYNPQGVDGLHVQPVSSPFSV